MTNYIYDLAENVLTYKAAVEAATAKRVEEPSKDDFIKYLRYLETRILIPDGTMETFGKLEALRSKTAPPTLDGLAEQYVKTIFLPEPLPPYVPPKHPYEEAEARKHLGRSIEVAADLVKLDYLFKAPKDWPEHKLLQLPAVFLKGDIDTSLFAFYSKSGSDDVLNELRDPEGYIYKPSYFALVTCLVGASGAASASLCAAGDISRICEEHYLYRFRKLDDNEFECDPDFLRFERSQDNYNKGAVWLVLPPWLASVGMKDHFPRQALSVVLRQEQRKNSVPEKKTPDDILVEAVSGAVNEVENSKKAYKINDIYELINERAEELSGKPLSVGSTLVAVGKTIRCRLEKLDKELPASFMQLCRSIKQRN